ncbi:hypothetical protein C9374_000692 [Naegleria lovaniensis]|uniref:Uncharacterized protein n=1 Tax=Naegleria lovaniensis TaxID=51637 RepID=A0AA88GZK0_NAELO|nr:uncharacterized protein C9374_000692 [Naegleria lovaniensis]KAG2388528.1 hypothetical protein C9374_000692 [Naegleria lovaniensis]
MMNTTTTSLQQPSPVHTDNYKHLLKKKSVVYDKEGNAYKKKLRKIFIGQDLQPQQHPQQYLYLQGGPTSAEQDISTSNSAAQSSSAPQSSTTTRDHHDSIITNTLIHTEQSATNFVCASSSSKDIHQEGIRINNTTCPKPFYSVGDAVRFREHSQLVTQIGFVYHKKASSLHEKERVPKCVVYMLSNEKYWVLEWLLMKENNIEVGARVFEGKTDSMSSSSLLNSTGARTGEQARSAEHDTTLDNTLLNNNSNQPHMNQQHSVAEGTNSTPSDFNKGESIHGHCMQQQDACNHSTITSRFNALHQQSSNKLAHGGQQPHSTQLSPFSHGIAKSLIHTLTTAHGCNSLMHQKSNHNLCTPASLQQLITLFQPKKSQNSNYAMVTNVDNNNKEKCNHHAEDNKPNAPHVDQCPIDSEQVVFATPIKNLSNAFRPITSVAEDFANNIMPPNEIMSDPKKKLSLLLVSSHHPSKRKKQLAHNSVLLTSQLNNKQHTTVENNNYQINTNNNIRVNSAGEQSEQHSNIASNNNNQNHSSCFAPSNNSTINNTYSGIHSTIPSNMNQFFIQPPSSSSNTDQSNDANSSFKKQIMLNHIHQRQQLVNQQLMELLNQQKRSSSSSLNSSGGFTGASQKFENQNNQLNVLNISNNAPSQQAHFQYNIQPSSGPFSQTTILFFNHNFDLRPTDLLQFLVIQVKDGQTLKASCLNPVVSYDNDTLLMLNEISNRVALNSLSSLDEELSKFVHSSPLLISMPPQDEPCSVLLVLMKNFVPVTSPILFEYTLP